MVKHLKNGTHGRGDFFLEKKCEQNDCWVTSYLPVNEQNNEHHPWPIGNTSANGKSFTAMLEYWKVTVVLAETLCVLANTLLLR